MPSDGSLILIDSYAKSIDIRVSDSDNNFIRFWLRNRFAKFLS